MSMTRHRAIPSMQSWPPSTSAFFEIWGSRTAARCRHDPWIRPPSDEGTGLGSRPCPWARPCMDRPLRLAGPRSFDARAGERPRPVQARVSRRMTVRIHRPADRRAAPTERPAASRSSTRSHPHRRRVASAETQCPIPAAAASDVAGSLETRPPSGVASGWQALRRPAGRPQHGVAHQPAVGRVQVRLAPVPQLDGDDPRLRVRGDPGHRPVARRLVGRQQHRHLR